MKLTVISCCGCWKRQKQTEIIMRPLVDGSTCEAERQLKVWTFPFRWPDLFASGTCVGILCRTLIGYRRQSSESIRFQRWRTSQQFPQCLRERKMQSRPSGRSFPLYPEPSLRNFKSISPHTLKDYQSRRHTILLVCLTMQPMPKISTILNPERMTFGS